MDKFRFLACITFLGLLLNFSFSIVTQKSAQPTPLQERSASLSAYPVRTTHVELVCTFDVVSVCFSARVTPNVATVPLQIEELFNSCKVCTSKMGPRAPDVEVFQCPFRDTLLASRACALEYATATDARQHL